MNKVLQRLAKIKWDLLTKEDLEKIYLEQFNEAEQKRLGQIFTPSYIVRFILYQINLISDLSLGLAQRDLKILDPACGLGNFLVETYEILKKKLRDLQCNDEEIHEVLLTRILYGVEIEPLAAQVTALALLSKRITQPISEIGITQFDILNPEEYISKNLKYVDLRSVFPNLSNETSVPSEKQVVLENFDVIIGNPPYFLITQKEGRIIRGKQFHSTFLPKSLIETYRSSYKAWPKHNKDQNIFYLFIERSIQLLREGGTLGFIVPDILLAGDSTENLRKIILETCCIKRIIVVKGKVFEKRGISNIIIILQRCSDAKIRDQNKVEIIFTSAQELNENDSQEIYDNFEIAPHCIPQSIFQATPQNNFAIRITEANFAMFEKVFKMLKKHELVKFGDFFEIQRGIENLKRKDAITGKNNYKETYHKLISASNIEKYRINWKAIPFPKKFVDYNPQNPDYKNINFKQRDWFVQPKIVLKRVCDRLIAAPDMPHENEADYFFTMDSVQMIWLKEEFKEKYDLRVILAILNSQFMNFYYQALFSYKQLFSRVQKAFLKELPIPSTISPEKNNEICELVDLLIKSFDENTEVTLNHLITSLYLSPEEFKLFDFI